MSISSISVTSETWIQSQANIWQQIFILSDDDRMVTAIDETDQIIKQIYRQGLYFKINPEGTDFSFRILSQAVTKKNRYGDDVKVFGIEQRFCLGVSYEQAAEQISKIFTLNQSIKALVVPYLESLIPVQGTTIHNIIFDYFNTTLAETLYGAIAKTSDVLFKNIFIHNRQKLLSTEQKRQLWTQLPYQIRPVLFLHLDAPDVTDDFGSGPADLIRPWPDDSRESTLTGYEQRWSIYKGSIGLPENHQIEEAVKKDLVPLEEFLEQNSSSLQNPFSLWQSFCSCLEGIIRCLFPCFFH